MTVNDELYIENLEEYVLDESKVVTYKWLSKTLEVHVNQAKQMLYSFVQNERNKKHNDHLNVTYFVSGIVEDGGEKVHKVQIVPEDHLDAIKAHLKPVTSCHIYSIQKAKVKDTNALYMTDIDIIKEHILSSNKFSAIRCTSAKLRSNDELLELKTVAQPTTNAPSFAKPKSESNSSSNGTTKPVSQAASKKPAGIAGMFATAGKKKDDKNKASPSKDTSSQESVKATSEENKKPNKAKQGGIANFFGNQAAKPKKSPEKVKRSEAVSTKEPSQKSPLKPQHKSPSPKPQGKTKSRRREESDNDEAQEKKRRRIKAAVWSDSSEDEDMEEEEPIPPREPTPPPARQPTPSPVKEPSPSPEKMDHSYENKSQTASTLLGSGVKRRKRQKKLVSKTFVDDSGFMVTEKVYESCSESASDEEPIPPTPPVKPVKPADKQEKEKKSPSSKNKKSPASAGGKKQASLMSFFKKK